MTRVYSLQTLRPGRFALTVTLFERDSYLGSIEALFTDSEVCQICYSNRFISDPLPVSFIGRELQDGLSKCILIQSGVSVDDLNDVSSGLLDF